jgi:hypothetical protein
LAQLLAALLETFKASGALASDFDCQVGGHVLYNIHNARFVQFMSNDSAEIADLYDTVHKDMAFTLRNSAAIALSRPQAPHIPKGENNAP